ncbi:unnamed protein product [Peniophora sp. CBMAI 1063]|nr:unnamed protein product [Peniophora sp. CBMAI 1063]
MPKKSDNSNSEADEQSLTELDAHNLTRDLFLISQVPGVLDVLSTDSILASWIRLAQLEHSTPQDASVPPITSTGPLEHSQGTRHSPPSTATDHEASTTPTSAPGPSAGTIRIPAKRHRQATAEEPSKRTRASTRTHTQSPCCPPSDDQAHNDQEVEEPQRQTRKAGGKSGAAPGGDGHPPRIEWKCNRGATTPENAALTKELMETIWADRAAGGPEGPLSQPVVEFVAMLASSTASDVVSWCDVIAVGRLEAANEGATPLEVILRRCELWESKGLVADVKGMVAHVELCMEVQRIWDDEVPQACKHSKLLSVLGVYRYLEGAGRGMRFSYKTLQRRLAKGAVCTAFARAAGLAGLILVAGLGLVDSLHACKAEELVNTLLSPVSVVLRSTLASSVVPTLATIDRRLDLGWVCNGQHLWKTTHLDEYLGRFQLNTFVLRPRCEVIWAAVIKAEVNRPRPIQFFSSQSDVAPGLAPVAPAGPAPAPACTAIPITWPELRTLTTSYDPANPRNTAKQHSSNRMEGARQTEEERMLARIGDVPTDWEDLCKRMSTQYVEGCRAEDGDYVHMPVSVTGEAFMLRTQPDGQPDSRFDLFAFRGMPDSERERFSNLLDAVTLSIDPLRSVNTAELGDEYSFPCYHFSIYNRSITKGHGAPAGVNPETLERHVMNTETGEHRPMRTNYSQFKPYESREMEKYRKLYDALTKALEALFTFISRRGRPTRSAHTGTRSRPGRPFSANSEASPSSFYVHGCWARTRWHWSRALRPLVSRRGVRAMYSRLVFRRPLASDATAPIFVACPLVATRTDLDSRIVAVVLGRRACFAFFALEVTQAHLFTVPSRPLAGAWRLRLR